MKLTNATEGHYNYHSKEFHKLDYTENCDAQHIKDETILTWAAAKELKADPCGHCWPGKSKRAKSKKIETPLPTTGMFA